MKKLISLAITLAVLVSVFAIGASAALPTYSPGAESEVFTEGFEGVSAGYDPRKGELSTIVGGWSDVSGSQRSVIASDDEAYGNVLNMAAFYLEKEDGSAQTGYTSQVGFGEVTGYAKYSVEFDIYPKYASAAFNLIIPWGDDTGNPAVLMLSPDLFTDIDLQPHATVTNAAALPAESLATNKWYHVKIDVNNEAISAMTTFKAATIANNISVTVKDLSTGTIVNATPVTTVAPATDSVYVAQAYANVRSLTGNADMSMGLYSCSGNFYYVSGEDGSKTEQYKAVYNVDNVALKTTPADTLFDTNSVLLEERTPVNQTAALGKTWNLPGGEIGAYDEENPDANIGDGYDAFNYVVTFDMTTDCDVISFEMYGKNTKNVAGREAIVCTTDDGGQARMFRIPVEEAARGKKFSYKLVNGQYTSYVYRAEFGSDEYTQLSDVKIANGASQVKCSMVRFLFHKNYGTNEGTYVDYENLLVVNKGAMAITNKTDSTVDIAFETGNKEKAFPVLAFFDAYDRMVDVSTPGEGEIANGEGTATFDMTDKAYETAQIFLWDSAEGLVPVAENPWVID